MVAEKNESVEFARPVDLARIGDAGTRLKIEANAAERAALAKRFDIPGIESLRATVELRRVRGGAAVQLAGQISADVTQSCVVTLEPVKQHVEEPFEIVYSDEVTHEQSAIGAVSDIAWPEPLPEGPLDVGEAVAEQLSLALDPYPRAPGVALEQQWTGERETAKPFAALSKLRKRSDSSG
jgi:uncharacterized metal-binding protein YceD (DUF177 family)